MSGGLFLVLEGVEGAGKTTQVRLLSEWLSELGLDHTVAREPGGTDVGEAIREVLLERDQLRIPAETELLLMLAARAAFVRHRVRPALERDEVVVADRFDFSTFAYQGYGRGLDLEEVRRLNAFATDGLRPHLYLVLDVTVEAGLRRQREEGKAEDRIESAGAAFLRRVREGYLELVDEEERAERIDASGAPDDVQRAVRDVLAGRFPETFPDLAV